MLHLGLLFSILLPLWTTARSCCPPCATWKSNTASIERIGKTERRYLGDSFIGGRTAQKIHVTGISISTVGVPETLLIDQYRYTSVDNDVVLLRSICNGPPESDTLYCSGAVPGDLWYAPDDDGECGPYPAGSHQVLDTATVLIGGMPLREMHFSAIDEFGNLVGDTLALTERVGLSNGTYDLFSACILVNLNETLLCYADSKINVIGKKGEFGCFSLVGSAENSTSKVLGCYRDPGQDVLNIQLTNEQFGAVLVDLLQKLLKQNSILSMYIKEIMGISANHEHVKEKYALEGMTGQYNAMPVAKFDLLTPDHQPQNAALEYAAAKPCFQNAVDLKARAANRSAKGLTINIHEQRHKLGSTYGKSPPQSFIAEIDNISSNTQFSDPQKRKNIVVLLSDELSADVKAMESIAKRALIDSSWNDLREPELVSSSST